MTAQLNLETNSQRSKLVISRLGWLTGKAIAFSTLANLALYALAGYFAPEVTAWQGASVGQIIGANIIYLLIGAVTFALVVRFSNRPGRHYKFVAIIGLLASLTLPIGAGFNGPSPATLPTVITLCLMHVISYEISTPMFIKHGLASK